MGTPPAHLPGQPALLCSWARETLTPRSLQPGWAPLCLSAHLVTVQALEADPGAFLELLIIYLSRGARFPAHRETHVGLNPVPSGVSPDWLSSSAYPAPPSMVIGSGASPLANESQSA